MKDDAAVTSLKLLKKAHELLHFKKVLHLKPEIIDVLEIIAKGTGVSVGAQKGKLAFGLSNAKKLAEAGIPTILALENREPGYLTVLVNPYIVGVFLFFSNESSHEIIQTRMSSTPAVIGINSVSLLKEREGEWVIIDGDRGCLYKAPEDADIFVEGETVLDVTGGLNIEELQKTIQDKHKDASYEELLRLNKQALKEWIDTAHQFKVTGNESLRIVVIEKSAIKNALHNLIKEEANKLGFNSIKLERDLSEAVLAGKFIVKRIDRKAIVIIERVKLLNLYGGGEKQGRQSVEGFMNFFKQKYPKTDIELYADDKKNFYGIKWDHDTRRNAELVSGISFNIGVIVEFEDLGKVEQALIEYYKLESLNEDTGKTDHPITPHKEPKDASAEGKSKEEINELVKKYGQDKLDEKELSKCYASLKAVEIVRNLLRNVTKPLIVGLGSGTTTWNYFLPLLGEAISTGEIENKDIIGISSSPKTEIIAQGYNINTATLEDYPEIDIVVDGADEIDSKFFAIKGGGGALTEEKKNINAAKEVILIVDQDKMVSVLGKFPFPLEVEESKLEDVKKALADLGGKNIFIRKQGSEIFRPGNRENRAILDVDFYPINNPRQLADALEKTSGVITQGIFFTGCIPTCVIVGNKDGVSIKQLSDIKASRKKVDISTQSTSGRRSGEAKDNSHPITSEARLGTDYEIVYTVKMKDADRKKIMEEAIQNYCKDELEGEEGVALLRLFAEKLWSLIYDPIVQHQMIIVREKEEKILGFIFYAEPTDNQDSYNVIFQYVLEQERHRKIGTVLVQGLVKYLANYGARPLLVSSKLTKMGEGLWKKLFGDGIIEETATPDKPGIQRTLKLSLGDYKGIEITQIVRKKNENDNGDSRNLYWEYFTQVQRREVWIRLEALDGLAEYLINLYPEALSILADGSYLYGHKDILPSDLDLSMVVKGKAYTGEVIWHSLKDISLFPDGFERVPDKLGIIMVGTEDLISGKDEKLDSIIISCRNVMVNIYGEDYFKEPISEEKLMFQAERLIKDGSKYLREDKKNIPKAIGRLIEAALILNKINPNLKVDAEYLFGLYEGYSKKEKDIAVLYQLAINRFDKTLENKSMVPNDASSQGDSREEVNGKIKQFGGIEGIIRKFKGVIPEEEIKGNGINDVVMRKLKENNVKFIRGPPEERVFNYAEDGIIYILIPQNAAKEDVKHEINAVLYPELNHPENQVISAAIKALGEDSVNISQELLELVIILCRVDLGEYFIEELFGKLSKKEDLATIAQCLSELIESLVKFKADKYFIRIVIGNLIDREDTANIIRKISGLAAAFVQAGLYGYGPEQIFKYISIRRDVANIAQQFSRLVAAFVQEGLDKYYIESIFKEIYIFEYPANTAANLIDNNAPRHFFKLTTAFKRCGLNEYCIEAILNNILLKKEELANICTILIDNDAGRPFFEFSTHLKQLGFPNNYIANIIGKLAVRKNAVNIAKQLPELTGVFTKINLNVNVIYAIIKNAATKEEDFIKSITVFLKSEKNNTMLETKALFLREILDNSFGYGIFVLITEFAEEEIKREKKREKKLTFFRGMVNIISRSAMVKEDTLEDWKILLNDFIKKLGYLANRDIVLVHRYLSKDKLLESEELRPYELWNIGIKSTGKSGIKDLEEAINARRKEVICERAIKEEHLDNPIIEAILGGLTGFYSVTWGHGVGKKITLKDFVRRFNQALIDGPIPVLDEAYKTEATFKVRKRGCVKFNQGTESLFGNFCSLIEEAADLSERASSEQLTEIKSQVMVTLKDEHRILDKKLRDNPNASAYIQQIKEDLRHLPLKIEESQDILALSITLAPQSWLFEKNIALSLITHIFSEHPNLREDLTGKLKDGLSVSSLLLIIELRNAFIKEHALKNLDRMMRRKLLSALSVDCFEKEISKMSVIEENIAEVHAFATKGILRELAGDIGNVCYTHNIDSFMSLEHITAVIFTEGEGLDERFAGSMLILENSFQNKPVLILRAINPSEELINAYNPEDFFKGVIEYAENIAQAKGGALIVAPVHSPGNLTNRGESIREAINKFVVGGVIKLDNKEDFNDRDITNSCKAVSSKQVSSSDPSRTDRPLAEQEQEEIKEILHKFSPQALALAENNSYLSIKQDVAHILRNKGHKDIAELLENSLVVRAPPELTKAIREFEKRQNVKVYALNIPANLIIIINEEVRELAHSLIHETVALSLQGKYPAQEIDI
ncbi:MAG: ribose 5-phosphate isomerase A [Candidatus Omnitrophica bacterium]|nr:ribose 5-phosphate isomerase A [Candidatus Omnitrophota bacterium]